MIDNQWMNEHTRKEQADRQMRERMKEGWLRQAERNKKQDTLTNNNWEWEREERKRRKERRLTRDDDEWTDKKEKRWLKDDWIEIWQNRLIDRKKENWKKKESKSNEKQTNKQTKASWNLIHLICWFVERELKRKNKQDEKRDW